MSANGKKYWRPDSRGDRYPMVETNLHHCLTPRCRRTVNKKKENSPFCWKCRWHTKKEKNPLMYSFGNLRRRAKQRGKEFALTFEQYRSFCLNTDYHKLKGKSSLSLSIDRIDNSRGYFADNIRAIELTTNSRRQFVPFFARQQENIAYKPTEEEIKAVENQL